MMKIKWLFLFFIFSISLSAQNSVLWEDFVEKKTKGGIPVLPDFSFAGYHFSEKGISKVEYRIFDVTEFGAIPDDEVSDKTAIRKAVKAAEKNGCGIVFFPKGKYIINRSGDDDEPIFITSSRIVFRGEGADENGSVLFFDRDLPASDPHKLWSVPFAIQVKGPGKEKLLTRVVSDSNRESYEVVMEDPSKIKAGDWVVLKLQSKDKELINKELYTKEARPEWTSIQQKGVVVNEFHLVKSVNGDTVSFYNPLHHKIEAKYKWSLYKASYVEEVGFEDLAFEGNWLKPFVHHRSAQDDGGWSILKMDRTINSWIQNCRFRNVSRVIHISRSAFCTVLDVVVDGNSGHNAVSVGGGSTGILVAKVEDRAGMWHTSGVSGGGCVGNVFWRCSHTDDTSFEMHASQPRCTLFDNVRGGFFSGRAGGAIQNLPNHLSHLVLWNYCEIDESEENFGFWASNTKYWKIVPPIIIGFHGSGTTFKKEDLLFEESTGIKVKPESLFEAQLELRLGELPRWLLPYQ
ncbi:DUF4955 domain-containing protein [Thermophagus sp. OGC60D27]|uniref:DUF4955 domain-containing protein n=1 Tax=Thermophagus sp. OGC60D27 TaxID=3458415 RepID=UPI004037D5F7